MDINDKGAWEMGREGFVSSMQRHSYFKDLGIEKANKWLNNYYDALERTNGENKQTKSAKSVSKPRKRK
jgi:hypothetical protein